MKVPSDMLIKDFGYKTKQLGQVPPLVEYSFIDILCLKLNQFKQLPNVKNSPQKLQGDGRELY